ncbi:Reverse transcriptase (RNA-dependent DNA polymerase) [bacterium A37T11]|nr:Reverse transcriptase (RNA-dependent DNA polymerase) [bacterium A37T11]
MVRNKDFVARYAFYPLIHAVIKERRFKLNQVHPERGKCHSFKKPDGSVKHNSKKRPLHYATHLDAIIFGYYSEIIIEKYEEYLKTVPGLSECITAYRQIPTGVDGKNKSTIHFAHESIEEIKSLTAEMECVVLKFDIKSFFNEIDHDMLKRQWADILGESRLPDDHYNVFKGVTRFSYVMRDDFRIDKKSHGRRAGFDEQKLSKLRKKRIHAFFESPKEFRDAVKSGELKLHKFPFWKDGKPVGFPQGLPISATLANLYLLKFDEDIFQNIVKIHGGFYRRYSDDIIVLCRPDVADFVEDYIRNAIQKCKVVISDEKTERFLFRYGILAKGERVLQSIKIKSDGTHHIGYPFTYLGFEFYGDKTLIKSANLAKFYRRMIRSTKTKAKRAVQAAKKIPGRPLKIYRNQLYRLYARYPLSAGQLSTRIKFWAKNAKGEYFFKTKSRSAKHNSNYLSYAHRASQTMNEPAIQKQINKHKKILFFAMSKHIKREINRNL